MEEVAFELGFHRLQGLRHAESRAGKDLQAEGAAEEDGLGVPNLAGRRVMSSIRWFPQGVLDHDRPFCAKTQERFRGSGISATLLLSLTARLPGLAETIDLPEGKGCLSGSWVPRGKSQLALCFPLHSLFRKICSPRKACNLSEWWHFDILFPL